MQFCRGGKSIPLKDAMEQFQERLAVERCEGLKSKKSQMVMIRRFHSRDRYGKLQIDVFREDVKGVSFCHEFIGGYLCPGFFAAKPSQPRIHAVAEALPSLKLTACT